jgi:hypothetical protein
MNTPPRNRAFFGLIALAVVGGAVAITTTFDEPAKAKAITGVDPLLIMSQAVDLPVVHYDDYSVVFN